MIKEICDLSVKELPKDFLENWIHFFVFIFVLVLQEKSEQNQQMSSKLVVQNVLTDIQESSKIFFYIKLKVHFREVCISFFLEGTVVKQIDKSQECIFPFGFSCRSRSRYHLQFSDKKLGSQISKKRNQFVVLGEETDQVSDRFKSLLCEFVMCVFEGQICLKSAFVDCFEHFSETFCKGIFKQQLLCFRYSQLDNDREQLLMSVEDKRKAMEVFGMFEVLCFPCDEATTRVLLQNFFKSSFERLAFSTLLEHLLDLLSSDSLTEGLPLFSKHQTVKIIIQQMRSSLTKYLLFLPLSYLGYCYYEYWTQQKAKEEMTRLVGNKSTLDDEYSRFLKCKSTVQLANILKKSIRYVKTHITEPYNYNPQIVDVDIIDSGITSGQWWSYPYHTKTTLKVNLHNYLDCQKEGFYSWLFWTGIRSTERLRITKTESEQAIIRALLQKRQNKCLQIVKNNRPTSNIEHEHYFIECLRKTAGPASMLDKELARMILLKEYPKMI